MRYRKLHANSTTRSLAPLPLLFSTKNPSSSTTQKSSRSSARSATMVPLRILSVPLSTKRRCTPCFHSWLRVLSLQRASSSECSSTLRLISFSSILCNSAALRLSSCPQARWFLLQSTITGAPPASSHSSSRTSALISIWSTRTLTRKRCSCSTRTASGTTKASTTKPLTWKTPLMRLSGTTSSTPTTSCEAALQRNKTHLDRVADS